MPILCSQKPPVTCHVTQGDSRCPSRTHTSWSSVGLWPHLLLPSASFCSRHLALWVFWAGSSFGALTVCLECSFPGIHVAHCRTSFREPFPDHPTPNYHTTPSGLPFLLLCFISVHGPHYWPIYYIIHLFVLLSAFSHYHVNFRKVNICACFVWWCARAPVTEAGL